jgi:hypothetical protein
LRLDRKARGRDRSDLLFAAGTPQTHSEAIVMASISSPHANEQPARRGIVVDPAITVWLLIAAASAWQIGASLAVRSLFTGMLVLAAVALAFAGSWRGDKSPATAARRGISEQM